MYIGRGGWLSGEHFEVQIAEETALEAYRDATRPYGFKHRPTFGERGSGVVSATMSYWHGVDFSTMAKTERAAAATVDVA